MFRYFGLMLSISFATNPFIRDFETLMSSENITFDSKQDVNLKLIGYTKQWSASQTAMVIA